MSPFQRNIGFIPLHSSKGPAPFILVFVAITVHQQRQHVFRREGFQRILTLNISNTLRTHKDIAVRIFFVVNTHRNPT